LLPDFRVRQRDYLLEISRAITQELELGSVFGAYPQYFDRDAGWTGWFDCIT